MGLSLHRGPVGGPWRGRCLTGVFERKMRFYQETLLPGESERDITSLPCLPYTTQYENNAMCGAITKCLCFKQCPRELRSSFIPHETL